MSDHLRQQQHHCHRRILTDPLRVITENANLLAQGQFDNKLPANLSSRTDEIGRLGEAFSTMSDSVRGVISGIGKITVAASAGALGERADAAGHQGDYFRIMAAINATLDVVCSYLDLLPGALALFNEGLRPLYMNRAMEDILARQGFRTDDYQLMARILSSGASDELPQEVPLLFGPTARNGDTYAANVTVADE
ncbi:HAMP domain-containing protein, partial [Deltaproteobacteria bacterium OttesenSCG-928-M10]|nr:HAMP domain-containing protein [Deltaproteobacteria bacterium OttesenSCG-928-M10]